MEAEASMVGKLLMPWERADRSMPLIFLKVIERFCLFLYSGRLALNKTNLWSEKGMSNTAQFLGVTPIQQTRSKMCPLECVGMSIYWCKPKLSRQDIKSLVAEFDVLSMWMLKSPSSSIFGDKSRVSARKLEKSVKTSELILGGW